MQLQILTGGKALFDLSKSTFGDGMTSPFLGPQFATRTATVSLLSPGVRTGDLIAHASRPKVLLICARETALLAEIRSMRRVALAYLTAQRNAGLSLAPIVLAVDRQSARAASAMDTLMCERVWLPLQRHDMAQLATIAAQPAPSTALASPATSLRLHDDSSSASYDNKLVRLTKSEFMLAKLFLGRLGAVISLNELFEVFSSHGKAATRSNVRVAIFELRIKLEQLCGSTLDLVTVYRRGYTLRQNGCRITPPN